MSDSDLAESDEEKIKRGRTEIVMLATLAFVAVAAFVVVIFLYRWKIGDTFSTVANDWSIFGAYVGGVLGPLISFLTLIAILITITLQRRLLLLQEKEFSALYKLQVETFNSQRQQASDISSEAERSRQADTKSAFLKSIERLDLNTIRDVQRLESTRANAMESLKRCRTSAELDEVGNGITNLSRRIDELEIRKLNLDALMLELTLTEYVSTADLQLRFHQAIQKIYAK